MNTIKSPVRPPLFGLYPIIDLEYISPVDSSRITGVILKAGADRINILQLRAKEQPAAVVLKAALEIRKLTESEKVLFIINDRIDIALMSNADGVHLGLSDIPIGEARELLGTEKIIGLSTHNIEEAREAIRLGADYISFGPIFKTRTKRDAHTPGGLNGLAAISRAMKDHLVPITAIGGITKENIEGTIKNGASMAAVISEILLSKDIPARVKELIKVIGPPPKVR